MRPTFFKGVCVGAAVSILVLVATTAFAGNGVGGIFNLGQVNTVNASTALKGTTANPQLDVEALGSGSAIVGRRSQTTPAGKFAALRGINSSTNANGIGVWGTQDGSGIGVLGSAQSGTGVRGTQLATTGRGFGVHGFTNSSAGFGGRFENLASGVGTVGVGLVALGRGHHDADLVIGPDGFAGAIEAAGPNGVEGNSNTPGGFGVSGDGPAVGVNGTATSPGGIGVSGTGGSTGVGVAANGGETGLAASGSAFGVDSSVTNTGAVGVRSTAGASANDAVQGNTANGVGDAIQGITSGSAAFGVFAITTGGGAGVVSSTSGGTGVSSFSSGGTAVSAGNSSATSPTVVGSNGTAGGIAGTFTGDTALNVEANGTFGIGLNATVTGDTNGDGDPANDGNDAIFASSDDTNNDAVITATTAAGSTEFSHEAIETIGFVDVNGNARVTGTLTKGAGAFEIDHPLDPAHYYLRHSFVESPDMKNVYDGIVTTDGSGRATVQLPDYFGALNKDPRYQLTVIGGGFAQAIVSRELADGGRTFEIRTSKPNVKVSWQVTGIRKDAYANAHRIKVVERKTGAAAGMFLHPELFGFPSARPLGLDLPRVQKGNSLAVLRQQADLLALAIRKAEQARREAARSGTANAPAAQK